MPIRVIFFGTDDLAIPALEALINNNNYQIVAVVTKPDSIKGRGHKKSSPKIANIARQNNIALLQPDKLVSIKETIIKLHPDIGALVAYGKIISRSILDLFPKGIINFHPSMLPVYRGPSPIETTIMNGDNFTGLSLIKLTEAMDAGKIYYQEKINLKGNETASYLYSKFAQRGSELMSTKLIDIYKGNLAGIKQDDSMAIYCNMIKKTDGELDPNNMTASECERLVRAFDIWPRCRINFMDRIVIVTKVKILDGFNGDNWPDVIKCKNNTFMQICQLISPKSGKNVSASDFIRGLK